MKFGKKWIQSSCRYQSFLSASFERRVQAYFFDLAFLFVVWLGFINWIKIDFPIYAFFLLLVMYFTIAHYCFKATLGKFIYGLRLSQTQDDKELPFYNIFGRETLGRVMSTGFAFVGYLWAIFSGDRGAWHDKVFGTKVVSLRPQSESSAQTIMTSFFVAFAYLSLMVTGYGTHLLLSPLPLHALTQKMKESDFNFEGLQGNLLRGYRIDKLSYEGQNADLTLKDLHITLSPSLKISKIVVGGGELQFQDFEEKKEISPAALMQFLKMIPFARTKHAFAVDKIEIQNLKILGKAGVKDIFQLKDLLFHHAQISHLQVSSNGDLRFDLAEFNSDQLKIHLPKGRFEKEQIIFNSGSRLHLLPMADGNVFLQEVSIDFQGIIKDFVPGEHRVQFSIGDAHWSLESLLISALQDKIRASIQGSEIKIVAEQWHPFRFLKDVPQVHSVNAYVQLTLAEEESHYKLKNWSGNFLIKNKKFIMGQVKQVSDIDSGIPFHTADDEYSFRVRNPLKHSDWLVVSTAQASSKAGLLSQLYFAQNVRDLNSEQIKYIQQEGKYYHFQLESQKELPVAKAKSKNPLDQLAKKGQWDTAFLLISQSLLYGDEHAKRESLLWLENKMITFTGGARIPLMTSWGINIANSDREISEEDSMNSDRAYLQGLAQLYIDGSRCAVESSTQDKISSMYDMIKISERRFASRPETVKKRMIAEVLNSEAGWSNRKPDTWVCTRQKGRLPSSKSGLFVDERSWQKRRGAAIRAFQAAALKKSK